MVDQRRSIVCKCKERLCFKFRRGTKVTHGTCPYCKTNIKLSFDTNGEKTLKLKKKEFIKKW